MTTRIPITIFNGFLGAGKTTIILQLLKQLNVDPNLPPPSNTDSTNTTSPPMSPNNGEQSPDLLSSPQPPTSPSNFTPKSKYSVVWIKNEFGVNEVDSVLAQQSSITSVKEITNGCLCCTLVGRLGDSLYELLLDNNIKCDRIIIETSGSAYPATLVQEINRIAYPNTKVSPTMFTNNVDSKEVRPLLNIRIDGVVCVVDGLNFEEYSDASYTAKIQAQYTDLIILNKWELMPSEESIERLKDMLYELHPEVQIVKTNKGWIHYDIVFGLESKLWDVLTNGEDDNEMNDAHAATKLDESRLGTDVDVVHLEWITPIRCYNLTTTTSISANHNKIAIPTQYDSFTPQNAITLVQFEEWLSQVSTFFHCLRIKGLVFLQLSLLQYDALRNASQYGETFSPTHLLSQLDKSTNTQDQPPPQSDQNTSNRQIMLTLPIIVNWAFNRWSFYPLPQYSPNLSSSSTSIQDNTTSHAYQLPHAIFTPSSLYHPQTCTHSTSTSTSSPHTQQSHPTDTTFHVHSRLTLFGGENTISTFAFKKLVKKFFPVSIRKDCCGGESETSTLREDLFHGGFLTVLSNEHSHNH